MADDPLLSPANTPPVPAPRTAFTKGNLFFGFMRHSRDREGRMVVRVIWGRVGVALAITLFTGWLTLATAAWAFVRYAHNFEDTSVLDFAFLPLRREDYNRRRGNDYIRRAKEALERKEYREAVFLLRVGLIKSPRNAEGRQIWAQILAQNSLLDEAIKVMDAGLEYSPNDPGYLQNYVSLLFARQYDERVRRFADEALARPDLTPELTAWFAVQAANAAYLRGRFDDAITYLDRYGLEDQLDGRLLRANIDWEQGRQDLALLQLRTWLTQGKQPERLYWQLFLRLREIGRNEEAAPVAALYGAAFPDSITARQALLLVYQDRQDRERIARTIDQILADFPDNGQAINVVAQFARTFGSVDAAERLAAHARASNLPDHIGPLMLLEARTTARDYATVLRDAAALRAAKPAWLDDFAGRIAGSEAVAHFGLGEPDLAKAGLQAYLVQPNARADDLVWTADRLLEVNAAVAAEEVYARATEADPLNQPALTGLIRLRLARRAMNDVPALIERLLAMRRPPPELLQRALDEFGSDYLIFSAARNEILPKLRAALASSRRADA